MISPMRKRRFFEEITLWELGRQIGTDPARLSVIERNYKQPSNDEKQRIAAALGCEVSDIFPETQSGSPTPDQLTHQRSINAEYRRGFLEGGGTESRMKLPHPEAGLPKEGK